MIKKTPLQRYQQAVDNGQIKLDSTQLNVMHHFETLYHQLEKQSATTKPWWKIVFSGKQTSPNGLYLWGGVGIGKTYMLDLFYHSLSTERKIRIHFHRFMQQVHAKLQEFQGHQDPLSYVARHFSLKTSVICLDEFLVNDITDAMLLARLLELLFKTNVCVVTTSNIPPDELYRNGLQRQQFLPAIALIKKHTHVIAIDSLNDYRLQTLEYEGVYFSPLDEKSEQSMNHLFAMYAHNADIAGETIEVNSRKILTIKHAQHAVWFDFTAICASPRSKSDYLAIAKRYPTIFMSNLPKILAHEDNKITYLIHLIDIFYDEGIELILSAEVLAEQLYIKGKKLFEFQRTLSRLREMQSIGYLKQHHLKTN